MIPIYICDDEKPVSDRLEHIISNQITILNGDMGLSVWLIRLKNC